MIIELCMNILFCLFCIKYTSCKRFRGVLVMTVATNIEFNYQFVNTYIYKGLHPFNLKGGGAMVFGGTFFSVNKFIFYVSDMDRKYILKPLNLYLKNIVFVEKNNVATT